MTILKRQIWIGFIVIIMASILMTSYQLGRFIFYNFADINDHRKFQSRPLQNNPLKFIFYTSSNGKSPKGVNNVPFDKFLEDNKTVAFLIIRNDSIQYEKYFKGYDKESIMPSFSMAKSVTSILIGCAIDEGLIKSVDEPIINYIPELKENGFEKVTVKHHLLLRWLFLSAIFPKKVYIL